VSKPLSKLTEENLGLFGVAPRTKRLVTLSKSDCCWHQTEEHVVVDDRPVVVSREIIDAREDVVIEREERLVGGTSVTTTRRRPETAAP
jgi:hypothetical protein